MTVNTFNIRTFQIFYEKREGFYGWYGFGGSGFQWHPELQIGFAFVPSLLFWSDVANNKAGEFQALILNIVRKNQRGKGSEN